MPDLNVYNLAVRTENPVPPDVLIEHIAVALRDFHFLGKVGINMTSAATTETYENKAHPFDGPEVFDDSPQLEEYTGPRGTHAEGGFTGVGNYQPVGVVHKGEFHFPTPAPFDGVPPAGAVRDGVWYPDVIGLMSDPYPHTTRAIDSLKEARGD